MHRQDRFSMFQLLMSGWRLAMRVYLSTPDVADWKYEGVAVDCDLLSGELGGRGNDGKYFAR